MGDSVMLGAASALRAKGMTVDAVKSRPFASGARLAASSKGARAVVLHLGTNGGARKADLDRALEALAGTRVVLVTVQLPAKPQYAYESSVNALLRGAPARYPNVRVLDWNAVTTRNPKLLAGDGIHLAAPSRYADLVAAAACG